MTIKDSTGNAGGNDGATNGGMSPRLPLKIPNGRLHVYKVIPEMTDKTGVKRTVAYYEQNGEKFKFMSKDEGIRADLTALGSRPDLAKVDEQVSWAGKGAISINVVPRQ